MFPIYDRKIVNFFKKYDLVELTKFIEIVQNCFEIYMNIFVF